MTTKSEAIIARMRERTRAMRPAQQQVPDVETITCPPVIISNRERMRPRFGGWESPRYEERHYGFHRRVKIIYVGFVLDRVESRRGKRGAKKPRYKTDHTKRRI